MQGNPEPQQQDNASGGDEPFWLRDTNDEGEQSGEDNTDRNPPGHTQNSKPQDNSRLQAFDPDGSEASSDDQKQKVSKFFNANVMLARKRDLEDEDDFEPSKGDDNSMSDKEKKLKSLLKPKRVKINKGMTCVNCAKRLVHYYLVLRR